MMVGRRLVRYERQQMLRDCSAASNGGPVPRTLPKSACADEKLESNILVRFHPKTTASATKCLLVNVAFRHACGSSPWPWRTTFAGPSTKVRSFGHRRGQSGFKHLRGRSSSCRFEMGAAVPDLTCTANTLVIVELFEDVRRASSPVGNGVDVNVFGIWARIGRLPIPSAFADVDRCVRGRHRRARAPVASSRTEMGRECCIARRLSVPDPDHGFVFISYASRDRGRVLPIVDQIQSHGVDAWIDRNRIPGGADYTQEIPGAIGHSACVVACLSVNAFESPNVNKELFLAWKKEKSGDPSSS